jgi:hypothetical protein
MIKNHLNKLRYLPPFKENLYRSNKRAKGQAGGNLSNLQMISGDLFKVGNYLTEIMKVMIQVGINQYSARVMYLLRKAKYHLGLRSALSNNLSP